MKLSGKLSFLTFVLPLILISNLSAYDGSPREQVDAFFYDISKGRYEKAIDKLYESNPAMSDKAQQLLILKQQFSSAELLYGEYLGNENIHYEELSPSLIRIVQLQKHEQHPITWEFYFYRPEKKWFLSQGVFVDQFQNVGAAKPSASKK